MKIYKYLLVLLVGLSVSCNGLLEEKPEGVYSKNNYYKTEADALSALLYAYVPLNYIEYTSRFMFFLGDVTTNQYHPYGKNVDTPLYSWDVNANSDEFLYFFKYCYISIGRANSVLENVSNMKNLAEKTRNQFLGEAYFLRAFNYFMLVKNYGSVPYRIKAVSGSADMQAPYGSIQQIYELIISDLTIANTLMPIDKNQGRADKIGAQALLSKAYITMASSKETGAPGYEWVASADEAYKEASKWASEVLNKQSTYSLDPDLLRVYDVENQYDGVEHIFITSMNRKASGMEGQYSQTPLMFGIGVPQIWVSSSITGGAGVKKFVNTGSNCWAVFRVDKDFYKSYDNLDLRKKLMADKIYNEDGTVLATYSEDNVNSPDPIKNAFFNPFCRKYTDPQSNGFRCSANIYLIRFAEVALTYAEAEGPTTEGYKWANKVRERAGLGELTPGLDVTAFRKAIWDEKERELAFEGHGLYELRRTNRVMEKITNKTVKENYAYFFPIPQREVDLN